MADCRISGAILFCLLVCACGADSDDAESDPCIAEHGRLGVDGVAGVAQGAQEACVEDGGTGCDASAFITEEAAICIAEREGLEEGARPWSSMLGYVLLDVDSDRPDRGRTIWRVTNTTITESDREGGVEFAIDASTGELLTEFGWMTIAD